MCSGKTPRLLALVENALGNDATLDGISSSISNQV